MVTLKTQQDLQNAGFTPAGIKRYEDTITAYGETLLKKSVAQGNLDKADDSPLEITHEHVRAAAHNIVSTFGKEKPSPLTIPIQIGEYLLTAGAGVGGGALKEKWGLPVLVICLAFAVVLFVVRNTALKR